MANNTITIQLPFSRAAISPGSTIETGSATGCPGVCSAVWAVVILGTTGGDSASFPGFKVPGEVRLGIAPAGTPTDEIDFSTKANVATNGSWTGALPRPGSPGEYDVVARSCWGSMEEPVCAQAGTTVTV